MRRLLPILRDIRFWILLFFLVHLYGISFPPLEVGHNWRQAIVNMVARNFFEGSNNILFPRVDMGGDESGIAGMEFPLLNYLIHLTASLFGWEHWYGRAINLLASVFGTLAFHRILRKLYSPRIAFYATLALLSSIWFTYSRKVMPDIFALSLVLIAFDQGLRYIEGRSKKGWSLLAFGIVGTLGVLSKIPAGYLFLFMVPLFLSREHPSHRRIKIAGVSVLMTFPVFFWYFHWVPYLNETYGAWSFPMNRDISEAAYGSWMEWPQVLKRFYSSAVKYIGFFCFLGGMVLALIRKERRILIPLTIGIPGFLLFMFEAGPRFPEHDYYVAPFVPLMALLIGYALDRIPDRRIALVLIAGIMVEGVANQLHKIPLDEHHRELSQLETDMDRISDQDALIMVNSGRNPTPLYFAHRKGWLSYNHKIRNPNFIKARIEEGCRYLLVLKKSFADPIDPPLGKEVLDKAAYSVYQLESSKEKDESRPEAS